MRKWFVLAHSSGRRLAALVAVTGIGLSVLTAHLRLSTEAYQVDLAFRHAADQAVSMIRRELLDYLAVLESVGALRLLSSDITAESFREFVQKGMLYQQRVLGVFGLAPRVPGIVRAVHEKALQDAGRTGYHIIEYVRDGHFERAGQRAVYFPVSYVAPEAGSIIPFGLNLSAVPGFPDGMTASAARGGPHVAGWLQNRGEEGLVMVVPVGPVFQGRQSGAPLDRVSGFAFAVLFPGEIVGRALKEHMPQGVSLQVLAPHDDGWRAVYPAAGKQDKPEAPDDGDHAAAYVRGLSLAGLNWRVVCEPEPGFIRERRTVLPWFYGLGGVALTLLIAGQVLQLAGRTERVRRLVDERTNELVQANEELGREIRRRHELQRQVIDISTREKAKIGRDLHDSLGQQLTGIGLHASALSRALAAVSEEHAGQAGQLASQLREARQTTRRMARGLTPVELDAEGLPRALEKMMEEMGEFCGIDCFAEGMGRFRVADQDVATHIFLLVQEAVNNAVRHGKPTEVRLVMHENGLSIEDDGCGFPFGEVQGDGLGLSIMRYRAEMVGAELSIRSRMPAGTVVELTWQQPANGLGQAS